MELKRYTLKELEAIGREIFYDYLSSEEEIFWFDFTFENLQNGLTPAHQIYENNLSILKSNEKRTKIYKEAINSPTVNPSCLKVLKKELEFLEQEHVYLKDSNMKNQKDLYKSSGSTDYCRSAVRIPLNKRLNSYYDDLILEVIYYDDVSTLNGRFEKYKELKTKEERYHFIRENTEITHLGFSYIRNGRHAYTSGIMGKLNTSDPRLNIASFLLLDSKYSDFENLTLNDISSIKNNDVKQFLQSKIDLDKEDLIELSSVNIRGDLYKIFVSPDKKDFYIRYVCRSTGRVYYNSLNLRNLSLSDEFKENDFESYARAWWNLNTLGSCTEGKPVIRL